MQLPLEKEFETEPEVNNQLTGSLQEQQINQDYQNYDAESSQEFQHVQDQAQNDPEVQNDIHGHVEFNHDTTNKEELGVLYETSLHYLESLKYFVSYYLF